MKRRERLGRQLRQLAIRRRTERRKRRDLLLAAMTLFLLFTLIGALTGWWELGYGCFLAGLGCLISWSILMLRQRRG